MASFGSDAIFLEKLIERARHIEVQVLADGHGNVIHLGERDCTIQRRHQKLIEEAPSPVLDDETRAGIGEAARLLAMQVDYLNAGTVEFLYDSKGEFYFMEMNTRIQVEHPVTEMVTGVDLVRRQLMIAEGEPLDISQLDVNIQGHSIECRINAEDPMRDFLPTPGRVEHIIFPQGLGVRIESAAFSGSDIPREYDSMIAKLIVHAETREEAIERMRRALLELKIGGVRSTKNIHFAIMNDPVFRSGDYNSTYIDKNLDEIKKDQFANPKIAAIAAAIEAYLRTYQRLPETAMKPVQPEGAWKMVNRGKTGF
jgi:acetyl-CoA carboxylase biotin carboxylase subunit